jgi:predicted lipoprotein with Yx(FWY)xxD motif
MTLSIRMGSFTRWPVVLIVAGSLLFAACGSSARQSSTSPSTSGISAGATPASGSDATVTVSAADVSGVGTVLMNGDGRTLYSLSSEKGGKITCTASNSCTNYWPSAALPSTMSRGIAGSGVQASLLGPATSPSGVRVVTYAGWPLYTFVGDSGSGTAAGQGMVSFGGTWWVLSPTGAPITKPATSAPGGTSSTTSGYGGY